MQAPSEPKIDTGMLEETARHPLRRIVTIIVLALVLAPFLIMFLNTEVAAAILVFDIFASLLILAVVAGLYYTGPTMTGYRASKSQRKHAAARRRMIQNFAAANGLTFDTERVSLTEQPGTMFSYGNDKAIKSVVGGSLLDIPYTLFQYSYALGDKRAARPEQHSATIMAMQMPRVLPHIVIDSFTDLRGRGTSSALPMVFDKKQRIRLEGDFDTFFNLYAPVHYQIPALSLMTPDVMLTLLENAVGCDIEIIGDKLYFYWASPEPTPELYQSIYHTAFIFLSELKRKLTSGDIYADAEQSRLHSSHDPSSGSRLLRSFIGRLIMFIKENPSLGILLASIFMFIALNDPYLDGQVTTPREAILLIVGRAIILLSLGILFLTPSVIYLVHRVGYYRSLVTLRRLRRRYGHPNK